MLTAYPDIAKGIISEKGGNGLVQICWAQRFCSKTTGSLSVSQCNSYTAPSGRVFTNSGIFNDTIPNTAGCDSIITINLTIVGNSTTGLLTISQCNSYTAPSGRVFTNSGIFKDTIPNTAGCDSIITINLTIIGNATTGLLTISQCNSYASPSGRVFTNSGIFKDTIPNTAGCDSIITINLTIVGNATNGLLTISQCNSYAAPSGRVFTNSGILKDTIPNTAGCDSIITINLTIIGNATTGLLTVSQCNSYTAPSGRVFTTAGIYKDTIPNAVGCDSIITINLTITSGQTTGTLSESVCEKYISPGGIVLTSSGIYRDTIINNAGCDSIITINLTIKNCQTGCKLYVPNAFSPNGLFSNKFFHGITECPLLNFDFMVYNRWGELVFHTNEPTAKWDGSYKGKECPAGGYVYIITYQFPSQIKKRQYGHVVLLR